ncbi:hypothetical protein [Pyxidicoccus trucidator]|uniref:hypothetical protein n=1 Tax=Pyxidicoccus trucidator TaxID=2709662 RepID=UPI0013D966AA|nr:hypothetical protein [Pyxidicoccus trucidator]
MALPRSDRSKPEHRAEWKGLEALRPRWAVRRWLDYLDNGALRYLRRYSAFLSTGRVPASDAGT